MNGRSGVCLTKGAYEEHVMVGISKVEYRTGAEDGFQLLTFSLQSSLRPAISVSDKMGVLSFVEKIRSSPCREDLSPKTILRLSGERH
jgi:hypothetical protein